MLKAAESRAEMNYPSDFHQNFSDFAGDFHAAQTVFAEQISRVAPLSKAEKRAFESVDRRVFIPQGFEKFLYSLDALPIAANQWISSPVTIAKMTSALSLANADSVLEIGCGSGYQAAILAKITRRVFTIERIERLLTEARARFKALNLTNIHTRFADGAEGWANYAPFDRVLISCETASVPAKLLDQLAIGGVLVTPIAGEIARFTKDNRGGFKERRVDSCAFVPMINGVERL